MRILDALRPHKRAHDLIELFETKVKPDLQKELADWPEEGTPVQSKKEERALLTAFLDRVESRIVALAVVDATQPSRTVDKKPELVIGKQ